MSTLTAYSRVSPFNKEEICAQFGIVDARETFTLQDVLSPEKEYTFSFWVSSDEAGSLAVGDTVIPTSSTWEKHSITFIAVDENFTFGFTTAGTYYIYHPKLEFGTIATDWSPAPEDIEEDVEQSIGETFDVINRTMTEQHTELVTTYEAIIMRALESYVEESEYSTYKETIESELKLLADEMTLRFSQTTSNIDKLDNDLQDKFNTITKYFTFNINGLTIGQIDNPNQVVIDNDEISILVNGAVVQRFDSNGKALIPDLTVTRSLNLLGLLIDVDSHGNINCEYVGV